MNAVTEKLKQSRLVPVVSTASAVDIARANGVRLSIDTNLRLKLWPLDTARETIHAAMTEIDIALPSHDVATQLTGLDDSDPPRAARYACAAATLTVAGFGAIDPIPQRAAVETLLQTTSGGQTCC